MSGLEEVTLSSDLLSHIQQRCQCHGGNLSAMHTTPALESSTGEDGEAEDTDFGAVMYITAVLVFYSLGIVVMIVKYLKTERKEMEEEMALDSFFKGIPSKKIEHNREAVNRVAIRAFHTLTSGPGAKRPSQLLMSAPMKKQGKGGVGCKPSVHIHSVEGVSPNPDDSDSSRGDTSPNLLYRERSKYLPRVSLMFRDSRVMQDNFRSLSGKSALENILSPEQRSPQCTTPSPFEQNGKARFCLDVPNEHSDHSDSSAISRSSSCKIVSEIPKQKHRRSKHHDTTRNGHTRQREDSTVRFAEDRAEDGRRSSSLKTKSRAKGSRSSHGHSRKKTAKRSEDPRPSTTPGTVKNNAHVNFASPPAGEAHSTVVHKSASGSVLGNGTLRSPVEQSVINKVASHTKLVAGSSDNGMVYATVIDDGQSHGKAVCPKRLLVSDV